MEKILKDLLKERIIYKIFSIGERNFIYFVHTKSNEMGYYTIINENDYNEIKNSFEFLDFSHHHFGDLLNVSDDVLKYFDLVLYSLDTPIGFHLGFKSKKCVPDMERFSIPLSYENINMILSLNDEKYSYIKGQIILFLKNVMKIYNDDFRLLIEAL